MKTAVVIYSHDGSCAFVAEEIKNQLNADVIRLYTTKEKKRSKIGLLFWGCGMVFSKKKPPLKPYTFNASAYDLIFIGAPVWAYSPAPPVITFLSEAGITGKKIALFVCHGGGKGNTLEKLKALTSGNEVIGEADFVEPVKADSAVIKKQITDWIKNIVK